MERYTVMTEDIENVTNREVVRQNRVSMASIGLMLAAVLATLGAFSVTDPNSSVCLFLGGSVKFFTGRNCYFFKPTGSWIKRMSVYFDNKERQALKDCLESKEFERLKGLKRQINSGVKMDVMLSSDNRFVAVQLSEYVPYTYEAFSPVMCYYAEDAFLLSDFFRNDKQ